ncbi:MAG TPA: glycoside hydrolase family 15 protein [Terriglobales bacterium]|nr:glycoside hydrolase family 15 protein [Terriglobales bacterium]
MQDLPSQSPAFGAPGMPPRWTRGAKDAVGAAYSAASRVWFTLAQGTLTEIYFPTVDRPQVRDLQYLFSDGSTFMVGERRDLDSSTENLSNSPEAGAALGYRVTMDDRQGRFQCRKQIIADPHLACVLINTSLTIAPALTHTLRAYVLCAPHLGGIGWHNNGWVIESAGRCLLLAQRDGIWLAIGSTVPLRHASAGFVGASDGWSDLADHLQPAFAFDNALDGNIALFAELDLGQRGRQHDFTVGIGFGDSQHAAVNTLLQSLDTDFACNRDRFLQQWSRTLPHRQPLEAQAFDGGKLYRRSVSLLLSHEDKTYPGALIASLSIPWGEAKGDEDLGGYHLVWTRDLVNSATGLLASGHSDTARRALIYLATSQHADGGFAQNFWINGTPYWQGIQLDEVAFPIILAWRMWKRGALGDFDPFPMVVRAAGYLMRHGPATPEERWEEAGGYSPSSLAAHIAGLVCAANFARSHGRHALEKLCLEYADFLEAHVEAWTVTTKGSLLQAVPRHYIRISPDESPDTSELHINNQAPGAPSEFPARDIVDAGFLELVRYGIRRPGDPLIEDSLRVVDAVLKVDTPFGPCWKRYNHDGYGQRADGSAFADWGQGRPWPLLTGERAHYELAAGRDIAGYIQTLERFANHLGLLPEQVWDQPDMPSAFLFNGRPTGSAMPLMWAHAEYIRLLRSRGDGAIFDLIPCVAERYLASRRRPPSTVEVWKRERQVAAITAPATLRVQLDQPFVLHFTRDGWTTTEETPALQTECGFSYADVKIAAAQRAPIEFTMRYGEAWEGRNYSAKINKS